MRSTAFNLDGLDLLYRAYRPHRTFALAVRHIGAAFFIFGPLGFLTLAPVWGPIFAENGFPLSSPSTWITIVTVGITFLVCLWFQYELVSLIVNYIRYYTSRKFVAFTQIIGALLVGGFTLWAWMAPFEFYLAHEPGLAGMIKHALRDNPDQRAALVSAAIMAVPTLLVAWIAADMIGGSMRMMGAGGRHWAAARGFAPRPGNPMKVRAVSGGMPFYLAHAKGKKRGLVPLEVANVMTALVVVLVVGGLIYGAPFFGMFAIMIPLRAAFQDDPERYLAYMNVVATDVGGVNLPPFVVIVAIVVIVFLIIALGVWAVIRAGAAAGRHARRRLTQGYDETRAEDERAPVLFLRSFKNDQVDLACTRFRGHQV